MPSADTQFKAGDPNSKKGGRPLGAKSKTTIAREAMQRAEEEVARLRENHVAGTVDPDYRPAQPGEKRWVMPLTFMLMELNNERNSRNFRAQMAIQAAPYCHRKMPTGVDAPADGPVPVTPVDLEALDATQLRQLIAITQVIKTNQAEAKDVEAGIVEMES